MISNSNNRGPEYWRSHDHQMPVHLGQYFSHKENTNPNVTKTIDTGRSAYKAGNAMDANNSKKNVKRILTRTANYNADSNKQQQQSHNKDQYQQRQNLYTSNSLEKQRNIHTQPEKYQDSARHEPMAISHPCNNNSFGKTQRRDEQQSNRSRSHHISNNLQSKSKSNKKVIHIRSHHKNANVQMQQGRAGCHKDIRAFEIEDEEMVMVNNSLTENQGRGPVVIQLDLFKHRHSVQDTQASSLASGHVINSKGAIHSINQICSNHSHKSACFIVNSSPYCKICAVKLITMGYTAIKIDTQPYLLPKNQQNQKYPAIQQPQSPPQQTHNHRIAHKNSHNLLHQQGPPSFQKPIINNIMTTRDQVTFQKSNIKNIMITRNQQLLKFIDQLDKIQPLLEHLTQKLDHTTSNTHRNSSNIPTIIQEHYRKVNTDLENHYNTILQQLAQIKQQIQAQLHQRYMESVEILSNMLETFEKEKDNLRFMRQDIMANVDNIMDEGSISQGKFQLVMHSFHQELYTVSDRVLNILNAHSYQAAKAIHLPSMRHQEGRIADRFINNFSPASISYQKLDINRLLLGQITQDNSKKQTSEGASFPELIVQNGIEYLQSMSSSPDRKKRIKEQSSNNNSDRFDDSEQSNQQHYEDGGHRLSFGNSGPQNLYNTAAHHQYRNTRINNIHQFSPHLNHKQICSPTFKFI